MTHNFIQTEGKSDRIHFSEDKALSKLEPTLISVSLARIYMLAAGRVHAVLLAPLCGSLQAWVPG